MQTFVQATCYSAGVSCKLEGLGCFFSPYHVYCLGLRLYCSNIEKTIAYILPDIEVALGTEGTLWGFKVGTEERGVHGISLISGYGLQTNSPVSVEKLKVKKLGFLIPFVP